MGRPSKYSEEFRLEAVALFRSSDQPRVEVARSLGISDGTLAARVKAQLPGSLDPHKRAELTRLREENAGLRMDGEIFRKAVAYSGYQFNISLKTVAGVRNPRGSPDQHQGVVTEATDIDQVVDAAEERVLVGDEVRRAGDVEDDRTVGWELELPLPPGLMEDKVPPPVEVELGCTHDGDPIVIQVRMGPHHLVGEVAIHTGMLAPQAISRARFVGLSNEMTAGHRGHARSLGHAEQEHLVVGVG